MRYKGVIVDLDGVIWRGDRLLWNNIEALKTLQQKGVKLVFLSNNATRSRIEYVEKLRSIGLDADVNNTINSAYAAAQYVREQGGYRVFIVGEAGLFHECSNAGLLPVTVGTMAEFVIVGLDRFVTYYKLTTASNMIRSGARFIAANKDTTYPVEDRLEPGAGCLVTFLEESTGKKPEIIVGKPNTWILDLALRKNNLSRKEILIVGDRLDTDIMLGINSGSDTLLLLTGVNTVEDVERTGINPTYISKDLKGFIDDYGDLFGF